MDNILTEFKKTSLAFDRIVTDDFYLPYNLASIQIQPNELVTASTLNIKLEKIYFNILYLYGLCNICNFEFPTTTTGWIGVTGTRFTPSANFKLQFSSNLTRANTAVSFLSAGIFLRDIDDSYAAVAFQNKFQNNLAIINKTDITLLNFQPNNTPKFILNQTLVDPISGSLTFQNITGIAVDNNTTLYVCDSLLNNVYAYDLYDSVSDDFTKSGKLFLKNFVGGQGGRYDPLKFNNVGKIAFDGSALVVEDVGNKCFKIFDKNLVWLNTVVTQSLFNSVTAFNAITYSPFYNSFYGVNNKQLYIIKFDNTYGSLSTTWYDFTSTLGSDENMLDIKFALYEPRIIYIVTNKRLIKKWTTKLDSNIGIYDKPNLYFLKWLTVLPKDTETDYINLYSASANLSSNKILLFEDTLNLISVLSDEINIYTLEDILLKDEEYVQSWVFAKCFKKLMYNMQLLVKKIGYRLFQGVDATNTPIFIKKGYNKFVLKYDMPDLNTFIDLGINENFQGAVINRCIERVYNLQLSMLESIINNDSVLTNLSPKVVSN